MKSVIKNYFSAFVTVCLVVAFSVVSFSATTYFYSKNFEFYRNDNGGLSISDYTEEISELVIPSELIDIKVNQIGSSAFKDRADITSVIIPDSVDLIHDFSFSAMPNLKNVVFSKNLTTMYLCAFYNCASLTTVDLSQTKLEILSSQVFSNCNSLQKVVLPGTCKSIYNSSLANCPSLTQVYIPASVQSIGARTFSNSPNVTIYGEFGSYAEQYADEHNIPFEGTVTHKLGDADLSGDINIKDATAVQYHSAGLSLFTGEALAVADVNRDGAVNVLDATEIQKFIAEIDSVLS